MRKQFPGFLVNRIQTAMFREVMALLEEGVASAKDIDKAVRCGFGLRLAVMGPFAVVDLAGVHLWYNGAQPLHPLLDASKVPQKLWQEMVEEGYLGERTGKGFFEYEPVSAPEIIKAREKKLLELLNILYQEKKGARHGGTYHRRGRVHRVRADKRVPRKGGRSGHLRQGRR